MAPTKTPENKIQISTPMPGPSQIESRLQMTAYTTPTTAPTLPFHLPNSTSHPPSAYHIGFYFSHLAVYPSNHKKQKQEKIKDIIAIKEKLPIDSVPIPFTHTHKWHACTIPRLLCWLCWWFWCFWWVLAVVDCSASVLLRLPPW